MFIAFQTAGMVIILIIASFYLAQKRLTLKSGFLFLLVSLVTFLLLFLDIFSIECILHQDLFSYNLTIFVCKLYLVFLVIESSMGLIYAVNGALKYNIKIRWVIYSIIILMIVASGILMFMYDLKFVVTDKELYTEGTSAYICYIVTGIFIITTIIYVILNSKVLSKGKRDSLLIWMIFWILAALVQFFFKYILVVGFASAAALIIIYVNLENPALSIDSETSIFNFSILEECMTDFYESKIDFKIVYIMLENKSQNDQERAKATILLSNILSSFTNNKLFSSRNTYLTFKNEYGFIILIRNSTTKEFFNLLDIRIKESEYEHDYKNVFDLKVILFEDSSILKNYEGFNDIMTELIDKKTISLKNQINYIDKSTIDKIEEAKKMATVLQNAIDNDLIEVYYQPIFSKKDNRFTAAEALIRIKDDDGNIIYPSSFIEIAEKNGLIATLGEMVFIHVCKFIKENNLNSLNMNYIEVNLSAIQCGNPNLADRYISIMEEYNIEPSNINLEITETASTNLKQTMLKNMNKLIEYGVEFSLDDFGTGNSNLNYIIEMPVEIVKFDRVLVNSYFNDDKAKLVISKIIEMIKSLNLSIVLEGIEDLDTINKALDMDIDYIQGYYYSKPVCKEEFIKFIKNNNLK